jgi:cohesin loading factor subunit SCC2
MRTLKDIYLRNNTDDMRTDIASVLLTRMKDPDEGVSDLARQIFEELWMVPYHESSKKDAIHQQLALQKHVSLFVRTVRANAFPLAELENFLQRILSNDSRNAAANYKVCMNMVAAMMDAIVDNEERSDKPSQHQLAESLTVFAKVQPKLFTGDQVKLLAAYLRNISNENLPMFRVVVVIYRHVLPVLSSSIDQEFLGGVLTDLMSSLTRLQKSELQLTADCLWIITGILGKRDRLVRLMLSALSNIQARENLNFMQAGQEKAADQVRRFIHLTGAFGSACDFDSLADEFRAKFTNWHGIEVCNLIIDIIYPFTQPKQPQKIREASIESVATICQAWPQLYLRTDVSKAFEFVFLKDEEGLEGIVLNGFQQFFAKAEKRSETGADIKVGDGAVHGQQRLATSYTATDQDGAAAAISQKLLPQFIRVALEKGNELALCATQVIASVYRQGLVHPKICVPAFVALETSSHQQIASIAFEEHRRLHHAHETMIEKEYIDAIRQAYRFQRDVVKDPRGFTLRKHDDKQHSEAKQSNYMPKLRSPFAVVNTGSAKVRKRFLANLCKELDFELPELDTTQEPPEHITYTRFILENLALFDYERFDDIVVVVDALQKLVTEGVGVSVAQAIEEEILNIRLDPRENQQAFQVEQPIAPMHIQNLVHPGRLRQLTVASMILTMAWETRTFLRQLWGLQKKLGQKSSGKDSKRGGVTRTPGFHSDKLFEEMSAILTALESQENQREQCRTFVEIVNIDREHRAASEEDCMEAEFVVKADGYETPVEDGESTGRGSNPPSTNGKSRKRRNSAALGTSAPKRRKCGTLKKNKPNGKQNGRAGSKSNTDDDDDGWD